MVALCAKSPVASGRPALDLASPPILYWYHVTSDSVPEL